MWHTLLHNSKFISSMRKHSVSTGLDVNQPLALCMTRKFHLGSVREIGIPNDICLPSMVEDKRCGICSCLQNN